MTKPFTDEDLRRLKGCGKIHTCVYCDMDLDALLSRLEAAEKVIESYRDHLADLHTRPCRFDDPPATDETLECMACWAFENVDDQAWRKSKGDLSDSEEAAGK